MKFIALKTTFGAIDDSIDDHITLIAKLTQPKFANNLFKPNK